MSRSNKKNIGVIIALLFTIFLGFFTLGCTKKPEDAGIKGLTQATLGVVIRNVSYERKIEEGGMLDLIILLENQGDSDAKNVKVYLDGLSAKWKPPTPIEKSIGNLPKGEKYTVEFSSTSPVLGENITYPFYIRVEYDYVSRYTAILEVNKEDKNVKVVIKSQSKSKAPISVNITEYRYDTNTNKLKMRFSLINNGIGRTVGDILLSPEDMRCDINRVAIKPESKIGEKEINCEFDLPSDFVNYYPQIRLTSSYRYIYRSQEYKIEVIVS